MRLSKRVKRLLPEFIRLRIIQSRRSKNGHRLIGRQMETVVEKKWQYDEMMGLWVRNRDPHARDSANRLLNEMRALIGRMSANPHWGEFEPSVKRMTIPGWRQAAVRAVSRRR